MVTVERLRRALQSRPRQVLRAPPGAVPAAVLLLLFVREGRVHLLLTKRTEEVEYHKGEISLPGGAYDDGDGSLQETALRESAEEVGIEAHRVEIWGCLDDFITTSSNFVVTPYVGMIPYPFDVQINHYEVAELVEVPLETLMEPKSFREEPRCHQGRWLSTFSYDCQGHVIWGVTARILRQFLELVADASGEENRLVTTPEPPK